MYLLILLLSLVIKSGSDITIQAEAPLTPDDKILIITAEPKHKKDVVEIHIASTTCKYDSVTVRNSNMENVTLKYIWKKCKKKIDIYYYVCTFSVSERMQFIMTLHGVNDVTKQEYSIWTKKIPYFDVKEGR